jgi:hypothetical protein
VCILYSYLKSLIERVYMPFKIIGLVISIAIIFTSCTSDGGSSEEGDYNKGWIVIETSSVYNDSTGDAYAYLKGTAFTNSSYTAHQCVGLCCLICRFDDSYPGVDVVWENRTTGTIGSAVSRYGTLTNWEHEWSAHVPLILGENEIIVSASDPEGNYASATTLVDYLPPAPTILSMDTGDSQIKLEWSNVYGADSYNIYFSIDPNFTKENATLVANVTSNLYTHFGLVNGQTYYYAITSVFNNIESILSEKTSAVAGTPEYPKNVTAIASGANIVVSWSDSPTATSYNLYWSNEKDILLTTANLISNVSSPYTHTDLIGIPYYYVVTALNNYGISDKSTEVSTMPELAPPAPENLTGVAIDLNWSSVNGITQYVLERCHGSGPYLPDPQSCFAVATEQIYTGTDNYFTDTNVFGGFGDESGWGYLYRVKAENGFGISGPSEVFGIIID